jgi:2Fe-2S ferredoxin
MHHAGSRREVEVQAGTTVMQAAVDNGIEGILGECGGCCSCATCHVHVDRQWLESLPPISDMEAELLAATASGRQPDSRLGCQITIEPHMDGMVVRLPASQL